MTSSLELPARPARKTTGRSATIIVISTAAALCLAWFVWFLTTPPELRVSDREANGNGLVDTPVYVGMYAEPDLGRTIRLSGVKVDATSGTEVRIQPLLCRGGSVGVTTQPTQFCDELLNPEGEEFTGQDSIVIEVVAPRATVVVIDRLRIGYHQDLRSATREAGFAKATLTFRARHIE